MLDVVLDQSPCRVDQTHDLAGKKQEKQEDMSDLLFRIDVLNMDV